MSSTNDENVNNSASNNIDDMMEPEPVLSREEVIVGELEQLELEPKKKEEILVPEPEAALIPEQKQGNVAESAPVDGANGVQEEKVDFDNISGNTDVPQQPLQVESEGKFQNAMIEMLSKCSNLVANKATHQLLLDDSTVTGLLVYNLGDKDPVVVERSFDIFFELSQVPENMPSLKKLEDQYILQGLKSVAKNKKMQGATREKAKKLLVQLKSFCPNKETKKDHEKDTQPLSELSGSARNVLASRPQVSGSNSNTNDASSAPSKVRSPPVNLNTTMSTLKRKNKGVESIFFIENDILQNKNERAQITQALMRIKGLISVTYAPDKGRCIIRRKRTILPEVFGQAVANAGFRVNLIVKNEKGDEEKIPIIGGQKENINYPPYPEEEDANESCDTALARNGPPEPEEEGKSILGRARRFLQNSFYW